MNSATDTSQTPRIIVAIDGFSSSGKSTMAKTLARKVGYRYIDSGAMYRAVTLYAMRHGMIAADGTVDAAALTAALPQIKIDFEVTPDGQHTTLDGADVEREIRSLQVSEHVSPVAAIPAVRHALVRMQQEFGHDKGIVMDGRDIGTTVFPTAEMKIFVNASAETRARRRYLELQAKGDTTATYEQVLDNVRSRDHIDTTRAESPLRRADDAKVIDNDNLSPRQQDDLLLEIFHDTVKSLSHA